MPYIYDQNGKRLGLAPGESSGVPDNWSFGASLWEFLHPGTVQAEDAAIGQTPRDYFEIWDGAFYGMASAAEETRQEIVQESKTVLNQIGPALLIGVVAVAAIAVLTRR